MPNSRLFLIAASLLVATFIAHRGQCQTPSRPNILYFYVDDMGWGSIGPNGQAKRSDAGLPFVRTPNLDALARQGVNFRRGYGCHVCSPARSSQQSGFHQGHTFADRNDPNNAKKAMRADEILMGDALSAAGYATGYWGKWGYGGSKSLPDPVIENIQTLPTSHGYQHVLAELHHVRAHTFFQPTLWKAPAPASAVGGLQLVPNSMQGYRNQDRYPSTPALQNHEDYPEVGYCDDAYAFAALDFVRQQGVRYNKSGQPFFGLLAVQIPHAPFDEITRLPEWDAAYRGDPHFSTLAEQTREWAAMVTRIDAHFGNILAALEDPNHDGDQSDSVTENTLVIFQSDNGGPGGKNLQELDANGGLRGVKGMIQEGGIRVPLLMRWPAAIHDDSALKVGTDCNRVVDVTDLLPTFCDLAGTPTPLGVDGVSIAPFLTGSGQQREREFLIHEAGNGQSIIRGQFKLIRSRKSRLALFDLESDPGESQDIADVHPELVRELEELLLGERVDEPKGFATTYHQWIGQDGEAMSDAEHWSDYEYSNAGVTYLSDRGAPQLSWIAEVKNAGGQASSSIADKDLEFLGLAVSGSHETATQTLVVPTGVRLNGRNEIRIGEFGRIVLEGGTLDSLRWVDIHPGAMLEGWGTVSTDVYNHGTLRTQTAGPLSVVGDFVQTQEGVMAIEVAKTGLTMSVKGTASVAGKLEITLQPTDNIPAGWSSTVINAAEIQGRFDHANDLVTLGNGKKFRIQYSDSAVTLVSQ